MKDMHIRFFHGEACVDKVVEGFSFERAVLLLWDNKFISLKKVSVPLTLMTIN